MARPGERCIRYHGHINVPAIPVQFAVCIDTTPGSPRLLRVNMCPGLQLPGLCDTSTVSVSETSVGSREYWSRFVFYRNDDTGGIHRQSVLFSLNAAKYAGIGGFL